MNLATIKLKKIIENINFLSKDVPLEEINIMEVCGTHTNLIAKMGIKNVLDKKINLISGPGCPVCVTDEGYIDAAIKLAREGFIIATFGDLMKVNGSETNLLAEKSKGRDIRVIYSVYDVIRMAELDKEKSFVLLAVGFETTAPLIACVVNTVLKLNIKNVLFLTSLKIMPPIIEKILNLKNRDIHGIICPGNVAVITGEKSFSFIYDKYKVPAVICGFEDKDIIGGIHFLISYINKKNNRLCQCGFQNLYKKYVRDNGNERAKMFMEDTFTIDDGIWRGIGLIENSSFVLSEEYKELDAVKRFGLEDYFKHNKKNLCKNNLCRCSDILLGNISPNKCALFGSICTPRSPVGPCMISSEGTCAAYYKVKV